MGHNKASRWLLRRGWWRLKAVAALYNADPGWLRRQAEKGTIPFLRVGQYAYFFQGVDVAAAFGKISDSGTYIAWVRAGRPLDPDGGGRT